MDKQQLCRMVRLGHQQATGEISPTKERREEEASVPRWTSSETDFSRVIEIK